MSFVNSVTDSWNLDLVLSPFFNDSIFCFRSVSVEDETVGLDSSFEVVLLSTVTKVEGDEEVVEELGVEDVAEVAVAVCGGVGVVRGTEGVVGGLEIVSVLNGRDTEGA
jgi:hypothetical protein